MAECCQHNYRTNSFDLINIINRRRDNNFDTEVGDDKYDEIQNIEEEMRKLGEIKTQQFIQPT